MQIINTTPHPITLQSPNGHVYAVQPCGVVLGAEPVEKYVGHHKTTGAKLVRVCFMPNKEMGGKLVRLETEHPDAIIVGSMIAARAFPGRVFALVPVEGFERVPPSQKRMRDDKFTTFAHFISTDCSLFRGAKYEI